MQSTNLIFGISNIVLGILFILFSIPLVSRRVPMNKIYGFRIRESYLSESHWYEINRYGGKQLIQWSSLLILIGIVYFIFPMNEPPVEKLNYALFVAPILICVFITVVKTMLYSKQLRLDINGRTESCRR